MSTEDSIHLVTAAEESAAVLLTYDNRRQGGRIPPLAMNEKFGIPPLKVMKPDDWHSEQLKSSAPLFAKKPGP